MNKGGEHADGSERGMRGPLPTNGHDGPAQDTADDQLQLMRLYENRFDARELADKQSLWRVLCTNFFQQYIGADDAVLDLGAGSCEFVNSIRAARRYAVDLNPATAEFAHADVVVLITDSERIAAVEDGSIDVVFTSNFFEHLRTKSSLVATLLECHRMLRPDGRLIVLMPNLRYLGARYWDYFDHHLPLTHRSLTEALEMTGFAIEEVLPRFLPYTVKHTRLPSHPSLVAAYLRVPFAWRILGRQMLVVGRAVKTTAAASGLQP